MAHAWNMDSKQWGDAVYIYLTSFFFERDDLVFYNSFAVFHLYSCIILLDRPFASATHLDPGASIGPCSFRNCPSSVGLGLLR